MRQHPEDFNTYKHGKTHNNRCVDCNKKIVFKARRCKNCANKGKLNPAYTTGIRVNGKKCTSCGKDIHYGNNLCKKCYNTTIVGKGNPNWKNGKSFLPYSPQFNEALKNYIRERDNYTCRLCGMSQIKHLKKYSCKLPIHHVNYDKACKDGRKLISLCHKCNGKVNSNRKYWKRYFEKILKEIYE